MKTGRAEPRAYRTRAELVSKDGHAGRSMVERSVWGVGGSG